MPPHSHSMSRTITTPTLVALMALSIALPSLAQAKLCDVRQYGAKGDGATKDTKSIQAAIDDCSAAGGGTVRLRGGRFVTAPLEIISDVTFDIE